MTSTCIYMYSWKSLFALLFLCLATLCVSSDHSDSFVVNNRILVYKNILKSVVLNYEFNYFSTYLFIKDLDE